MTPRGGPDGGDGGKGGDVVFRSNPRLHSLLDLRFKKKYLAPNGQPGGASMCTGADGYDLVIEVPPGTIVKNLKDEVLLDLDKNQSAVFLKGGRGGKGNYFFRTSVNQAPDHAQPGERGSADELHLELKLIADVGIIGFPNAGKSTLISRISAARPKIADYPFTTLVPNLGVVKYAAEKTFVVADIPGLVKDAHLGVGLGSQFLRHIERTKAFVHLVDLSDLNPRDPWQDYLDINHELQSYDEQNKDKEGFWPLSTRKQLVCLTKIDSVTEERKIEVGEKFQQNGVEVSFISAVSGLGMKGLLDHLAKEIFADGE